MGDRRLLQWGNHYLSMATSEKPKESLDGFRIGADDSGEKGGWVHPRKKSKKSNMGGFGGVGKRFRWRALDTPLEKKGSLSRGVPTVWKWVSILLFLKAKIYVEAYENLSS